MVAAKSFWPRFALSSLNWNKHRLITRKRLTQTKSYRTKLAI
jgi:hypothetical protein